MVPSRSSLSRLRTGAVVLVAVVSLSACGGAAAPPLAAGSPVPLIESSSDEPLWGASFVARVDLPVGELGPRTTVAVDPRLVDGVSWTGSKWKMNRDWDEQLDGGYLDFGAAALDVNGRTIIGFRIEVPPGIDSGNLVDRAQEIGYFEITNPNQFPVNSYLNRVTLAYNYVALGVVGDAIKVGEGFSTHRDAYIEMNVLAGGPDDKHYDGAQIFRSGSASLERIVFNWNDAGTIANTTGAIFTQDEASLTARNIVILNPGGTWQTIRLSGSGPHDLDQVQVTGVQLPNNLQPGSKTPTALVKIANDSDRFTLYNEVPGASDWLIQEP